jgi:hypothetical protein
MRLSGTTIEPCAWLRSGSHAAAVAAKMSAAGTSDERRKASGCDTVGFLLE